MNGHQPLSTFKVAGCTIFSLVAFAGNSILCRLALGEQAIDAASFTSIRLLSGALVLSLILKLSRSKRSVRPCGSWTSAAALFLYATAFSFAYLSLNTGTGALILFGAVQLTMITAALSSGERLQSSETIGVSLAFAGLIYLVSPGVTAPSLTGALLMAVSGISWGVYSLRGRDTEYPLAETTENFVRTLPFVAALSLFCLQNGHFSLRGILLAVVSGGFASGIVYVIWYAALAGMTATKASIVQLAVPVLASLGGVIFLSEEITVRLIIATITILGGVGLAAAWGKSLGQESRR